VFRLPAIGSKEEAAMKTTLQRILRLGGLVLVSFVAGLLATGCGGGGGGSSFKPGEVVDQRPGGLWEGTVYFNDDPSVFEMVAVSTDDGEMRGVNGAGSIYHAHVNVSGVTFSGNIRVFAPPGTTFTDGSTVTTGDLQGTIDERAEAEGTFTLGTGDTGMFTLVYDDLYERNSSLVLVGGMWTDMSGTVFTVTAEGAIFAQDGLGCVYEGQMSIIDAAYDVYDVEVHVTQCGLYDGAYHGLGVLDDIAFEGDNDGLIVIMSNDELAQVLLLERM